MFLNKSTGNVVTIDSNDSKIQDTNRPVNGNTNSLLSTSAMQMSYELFKKRINESEIKVKPTNTSAAEDAVNEGSNHEILNEESVVKLTNDIKLIWLQRVLNFIKCDYQIAIKFPTIYLSETGFIDAILNNDCAPGLDGRFGAIYLSIKEALTVYETKYLFVLNTVYENETIIKLELEKIPKSSKLKLSDFAEVQQNEETEERLKKVLNHKIDIMSAVPMLYIIDSYRQILNFLEDDSRFILAFENLSKNKYEFMINVKQILKKREVLERELPAELNTLLDRIATHNDYTFNLIQKKDGEEKYLLLMKLPKPGTKGIFLSKKVSNDACNLNNNCTEQKQNKMETTETNNNNIYLNKIVNPIRNTSKSINTFNLNYNCPEQKRYEKETANNSVFKKITPISKETKRNSWGDLDISYWQPPPKADSLHVFNEQNINASDLKQNPNEMELNNNSVYKKSMEPVPYQTKRIVQPEGTEYKSGGRSVVSDDEGSTGKERTGLRRRSWTRNGDVNKMKSKLVEALSIPLQSTKATRIMKLMGWTGGALGMRGEGITEPIMPAIGFSKGAGLGHGTDIFKPNIIKPTTVTNNEPAVPVSQPEKTSKKDKSSKKSKKALRKMSRIIESEELRLNILSDVIQFLMSSDTKTVLTFDKKLREEETRFIICSTDRFNRRKYVRNLKSPDGVDALRRVQEVMLAKPDLILAAKVSENEKEIVLTKTFKGQNNNDIGLDFALDNDSIRVNISVFRYIKTMKPRESYGIFTKPSYNLLGFKLSVLEQILKFMDNKETTLLLYTDITLNDKHTEFLQNFINVLNMGRKPRYPTVEEELLVEKIYNKMGDYCFFLEFFRPLKIIKLQKKNRITQDSNDYIIKNKSTNNVLGIDTNASTDKKLPDSEIISKKEFSIDLNKQKNEVSTSDRTQVEIQQHTKGHNHKPYAELSATTNSTEFEIEEVRPDKNLQKSIVVTKSDNGERQVRNCILQNIQRKDNLELKEKIVTNNCESQRKDSKDKEVAEVILQLDIEENSNESTLSTETDDLLESIKQLEQSLNDEMKLEKHSENKKIRSLSINEQNAKYCEKSYKQIHIRPNNIKEEMTTIVAGTVQHVISNAIDSAQILPLLQCHGIIDGTLLYTCCDEKTYSWIKTVLDDKFAILTSAVRLAGIYRMQMKLKSYIYEDTSKMLRRIKMYNEQLDVDSWNVIKKTVSIDYTLLEIEVEKEDYNFISQRNFSLFAGIDEAKFTVISN